MIIFDHKNLELCDTDVLRIELYISYVLSECKYTPECCYGAEFSILEGAQ